MIVTALRTVGVVVAGIVVVGILVVAVEFFSGIVHLFPEGFEGSPHELRQRVERYPHWVLVVVVDAWGFTARRSVSGSGWPPLSQLSPRHGPCMCRARARCSEWWGRRQHVSRDGRDVSEAWRNS